MATITFDMLELVEKLKAAGFAQEQAALIIVPAGSATNSVVRPSWPDNDWAGSPHYRPRTSDRLER